MSLTILVAVSLSRLEEIQEANEGRLTAKLTPLPPTFGAIFTGIGFFDQSGYAVSSAGDVNGDGIDDILIGADGAAPNGASYAGETYVVFGT